MNLPRQRELRLKYRALIDELPSIDVVVPAEAIEKKNAVYCVEFRDQMPKDVAFELIKNAVDDALEIPELYR